ncbi:2-oxo-4-hydroxy-4-carboxy-5-ureidoimidazoline decarboxylase [Microcoleus sp. LEGE 07076]|uniref:2-oxo-4-hydroxy-4-carboxy-5-ureidoimidazoline decarboxylase n=1 Tax=Microcoleus sp. LEGE 07076 TaxID=915322 RepID=UPI001881A1D6|nr:2-oxo-4-hydroxy-4-carboxy-5-ureidoimidazoline decarboxylase [Microcoleus sp. LEGE 07076]MBE9184996.1 2-oxo-4-hydroxy-4-carboxy-5-ureidoimidazoline decarboxylase [Microcoleus sp. LEGE 07076]
MQYSLVELNQMGSEEFTEALGAIFEHTPDIARRTWDDRPFASTAELYAKMVTVVNSMTEAEKLALIQAHPDLGSKAKMAEASVNEQAGAGLDRLSVEEFDRFQSLNRSYREKFGFPFIVAVKNHTKTSILAAFKQRLDNSFETEIQQAVAEICQIARFRLESAIHN